MPSHANELATYKKIRDVRFRINNKLAETLDKEALNECGRRLGILKRGVLVLGSEAEMSVLMDYGIYNYRRDGRNAVEKYLAETLPPAGSIERTVLEAMLKAHYSLLQVVEVERGVGLIVRDMLRGGTDFLTDLGLSVSAQKNMIVATRVIPWDTFIMTGGAALPITLQAMKRIQKAIDREFDPKTTDFSQVTPEEEAELAALVIRESLATGVSSRVAYTEPGQPLGQPSRRGVQSTLPVSSPESREGRRNSPCPCGSGKKYRACCGKR